MIDISTKIPSFEDMVNNGFIDIDTIVIDKWNELGKPIKLFISTEDTSATSTIVTYSQKSFAEPQLELTVPEYRLIDKLEKPISILTMTDQDSTPVLKQEYDYPNIGTRIMKRG